MNSKPSEPRKFRLSRSCIVNIKNVLTARCGNQIMHINIAGVAEEGGKELKAAAWVPAHICRSSVSLSLNMLDDDK